MNDKVELVIASFAVPLFVVTILFIVIVLMSIFSPEQTVEEKRDILTEIKLEEEFNNLAVNVEELNLHFVEGVNKIYHSRELSLSRNDGLKITRGDGVLDRLHMVDSDLIIQNNHSYNSLELQGDKLKIDGQFKTDKLNIDYRELDLDIKSEAKQVNIIADQISGNSFFEGENFHAESDEFNADIEFSDQHSIEIISDKIDSTIEFKDQGWSEEKEIILTGEGQVEVLLDESDKEDLKIESSPEVEVEISYY